jgi:hypothetical protein
MLNIFVESWQNNNRIKKFKFTVVIENKYRNKELNPLKILEQYLYITLTATDKSKE